MRPFTAESVQQFVNNWYYANEAMRSQRDDPGVRMKAKDGAQDLLHRLRQTPALSALAINPLLLTMNYDCPLLPGHAPRQTSNALC